MQRVATDTLKNINSFERLTGLFCRDLNYGYSGSVISKRSWKDPIANSVRESLLIGTQGDFHIIYCQIEKLLLGIERPIINQLLKEHPYLLVVFSDPQYTNWHFVNVKYDEELRNRRLFRRIVIGPDERLHTAAQRVNMLEVVDEKISSLELQTKHDEAFDVEEVTKEFYEKYAEIFHMLSEDITEENPREDTYKEAQIILDRLVFLYFIQKKGWLNNNKRYLYENFLRFWRCDPKGNNFYSDFLVRLFQALSSQGNLYRETLGDIPFLNGGLFEVDPFHSKLPFRLIIKNYTFKQIFDNLLEHFNFTVREDTPLDIEVAIDPEMLGKIFENLVLKLEKGEDLRRKTGSYYTPRAIVHFMCQQSLKEYLISESEIDRSKIELLFTMTPTDQLTEGESKKLEQLILIPQARLLKSLVKRAYILDPAVGSGAFLVSMLHEMLSIIKLLEIKEFGQDYIQRTNYDYELKRQLIETSLYGVDIQEQAVRICELRLWLSLIVDYEKVKDEDVPPLPNLSYKIRCGDSLIEKLFGHNVQLDQLVQTDKGKQLIDKIREDKKAYFLARDIREKDTIELSTLLKQCELMELLIKAKQKSLIGPQLSFFEESAKEKKKREEFEKIKREYENILLTASNTKKKVEAMLKGKISIPAEDIHNLKKKLGISFIWKLDFAEVFKLKGGFDVIIGNPPYVEARNSARFPNRLKDELQKSIQQMWGIDASYITRGSDLLVYFFVQGVRLLNTNGIFVFITQNSWLSTNYGFSFQKFIAKNILILKIIDSDYKYFESAQINTVITIFKSKGNKKTDSNISTFERYHTDFGKIPLETAINKRLISVKRFAQKELCSSEMKWGVYLSASDVFLKVFERLRSCAKNISEIKEANVTCGQGVNLNKTFYLEPETILKYKIDRVGLIPIMGSKDGAPFVLQNTHKYLCHYGKISTDIHRELIKLGISIFDQADRPSPTLILPRGIGRHFCSINSCNALSSSGVDIYAIGNRTNIEKIKLQLWVFLNSSVGWFIREIGGRKNLGGGMLKAEATDLKMFPIYLDLDVQKCTEIFKSLINKEALQPLQEIQTPRHIMIDDIIFEYLKINDSDRKTFLKSLIDTITLRGEKAKTLGER